MLGHESSVYITKLTKVQNPTSLKATICSCLAKLKVRFLPSEAYYKLKDIVDNIIACSSGLFVSNASIQALFMLYGSLSFGDRVNEFAQVFHSIIQKT